MNTIIVLLIVVGIAFYVVKSLKREKKPEPPPPQATAPTKPQQYVPDSATIKDNASAAVYRDQLAPSTRAFMRDGPYFDKDGTALDTRGNPIRSENFGPIAGAKVSVPGQTTITYRGPVTLAPVAGETNTKVGVRVVFLNAAGQRIGEQSVGSEGNQFPLPVKNGESVTVVLDAPASTVYWVKP